MRVVLPVLLGAVLLAGCVQEPVSGSRTANPVAGARDRVALAAEHLRNGDNEKAQIQLKRALDMDSRSAEAHNLMGVLLERDGDKRGAERAYRRAVKLRPEFAQAHNNYGVFLFKNERYKDAFKQFEAAANDLGYDLRAQAFEGMGRSALKLGDKDTATRSFVRALRIDAGLPTSNLELGELQFAQGNFDAARSSYQRYLKLTEGLPQTAQSLWLGIRLERRFGGKNALASYELALKRLYPNSPEYKLYAESLKP